jgi:hypothetical protein
MKLMVEKRFFHRAILTFAGLCAFGCLPANADSILGFYTGDPNELASGVTNIINPTGVSGFNNGDPYFSNIYESFVVPAGGWTITGVFSDDSLDFTDTQAEWEIRKGMGSGNGGTVVASGTSPAIVTSTGLVDSPDGVTIYQVTVNSLSVTLGPGTYWLTVAPVGDGDSGIIGTNGANAVDATVANIANFPADGLNYFFDGQSKGISDFTMGAYISSAPEPNTLFLSGLVMSLTVALLAFRRRKETTR